MSHQAVSAVLARSKVKGSDRLALLVIASHADKDTFECHPGRDLLCQETAMSERNLIYCLKRLEEMGELVITRGSGRGRLTTYQIRLDDPQKVQAASPFPGPNKVQAASPFDGSEKVQNPAETMQATAPFESERVQAAASFENEKGCNPASERVQNPVIKGAKSGCAYKDIEPSGTVREEEKDMSGATAPGVTVSAGDVGEVFAYWQYRLNHQQAKLTPERKKKIQARLGQGYTVQQIKQAIDGCANSPFHRGENQSGTVYDDLTLICRDGSKLESFIAKATNGGSLDKFSPAARQTIAAGEAFVRRMTEQGDL